MKTVIVHARYSSLIEHNDSQLAIYQEDLDQVLNHDYIIFKNLGEQQITNSGLMGQKYLCKFMERKNYNFASFEGKSIPYVDINYDFYAYAIPEYNVIFFNESTETSNKFITKYNRICKSNGQALLERFDINFDTIEQKSSRITGAWFSTQGVSVSSQAIMGADIQQSVEYLELKSVGTPSSFTIEFRYPEYNRFFSVIVSRKGSIYIRNKIHPEMNHIDILWKVFKELIL